MNASLPSGYKEVTVNGRIEIHSKYWYQRREGLKGKTGHWSKWDKKTQTYQTLSEIWCCQSCGEQQPKELSPLVVKNGEINLRVCPFCFNDNLIELKRRIREIDLM